MFAGATAARFLAPAAVAALVAIYKYYKSGAKTEVPDHMSPYPPGGGGGGGDGGGAPPQPPGDRAPPDLDPALVDKILNLVSAHLDANRNFNNPAVLAEILKLIRNSDPAFLDKVEKLSLEAETETESPTIMQESRLDHAPSEHRKHRGGGDGGGGGQNESDDGGGGDAEKAAEESWSTTYQYYPVRPEAQDCSFYLKTGTCKFGSNCKFNHPVNRRSDQCVGDFGFWDESAESPGQTECKYYLRPGGSKHGRACRYIHSREKPTVAPVMDTNFAGLPIRPGEKECAYYMRHGECKYASNCRFSHPDPVAERGSDPSSGYDKVGPALQGASEATWSAPRSLNETPLYMPMMIPLSPGVPAPTTEWNGYQGKKNCPYYMQYGSCKYGLNCKYNHPVSRYGNGGPATFQDASPSTVEPSSARRSLNKTPHYVPPMVIPPSEWGPYTKLNSYQAPANLPEQSMPVPQPYGIDNSVTETTTYQQHPLKKQVEESPERPVCSFFSKTGYCHKSNCNYHHPKYQTSVSPSCELSAKGLPLRPGQNICTQYSSYGICKSGPSCKFDHPSLPTFTL